MWDWLILRYKRVLNVGLAIFKTYCIGQLNVGLANCKTESDIERGIAKNSLMVSTTV